MLTNGLLSAAALLSHILLVNASDEASGMAIIKNSCSHSVYLDVVSAQNSTEYILSAGETFEQHHWTRVISGPNEEPVETGWSLKLRANSSWLQSFEFEYTWPAPETPSSDDPGVAFHFSCVAAGPFTENWFPTSSRPLKNGSWPEKVCYNHPVGDLDSIQSRCTPDTNITLTLC